MGMTMYEKIENVWDRIDDTSLKMTIMMDAVIEDYIDRTNIIYRMQDFDDFMDWASPIEVANMVYDGNFNPDDDYFVYAIYGNLESFSDISLEYYINEHKEKIISYLSDNFHYTRYSTIIDTLKDLYGEEDDD